MSGVGVTLDVNDKEAQELLSQIARRIGDVEPALKVIGGIIRTSVVRNFEKSGRPLKWNAHSETTMARRGAGAPILVQQGMAGGLMGSVSVSTDNWPLNQKNLIFDIFLRFQPSVFIGRGERI